MQKNPPVFYETDSALSQYLLFHYGEDSDLMPYVFGPRESLHFPVRCVKECLDWENHPAGMKALDLGCAVGRSSFELSRYCQSVVGVDYSSSFIQAAKDIQQFGQYDYTQREEGVQTSRKTAFLPKGTNPCRVTFVCADAMDFAKKRDTYDVVFAANLICRLQKPAVFLSLLKNIIVQGGHLILAAPYSWLEEYTPASDWLGQEGKKGALDSLKEILETDFELLRCVDIPFLIREHIRKFQWGVSQATLWKRRCSV